MRAGQKNGRLVLVRRETQDSRRGWICRCKCGVERWLRADGLGKRFRSCRCPIQAFDKRMKFCVACGKKHRISAFYIDRRTGGSRGAKCKKATSKISNRWHKRNPDREASRLRARNQHPKERFGLSRKEYDRILKSFGNLCGICSGKETRSDRSSLSLDHCHRTGKIRGALCSRCNTILGFAKDDPILLTNAAAYLEKYQ